MNAIFESKNVVFPENIVPSIKSNCPDKDVVIGLYICSVISILSTSCKIISSLFDKIDKLDVAIQQRIKVINYPFTFVENPILETERKIDTSLKNKLIDNINFIKAFIGILLEYAYKNKDLNTIEIPLKVKSSVDNTDVLVPS